jgi:hypothetical protein
MLADASPSPSKCRHFNAQTQGSETGKQASTTRHILIQRHARTDTTIPVHHTISATSVICRCRCCSMHLCNHAQSPQAYPLPRMHTTCLKQRTPSQQRHTTALAGCSDRGCLLIQQTDAATMLQVVSSGCNCTHKLKLCMLQQQQQHDEARLLGAPHMCLQTLLQ